MLLGTGALIGTGNGKMTVGSDIFIGPYCVIGGGGDLSIGSDVMIASHSRIMSSEHIIDDSAQSIWAVTTRGVRIGSGVWLGAGVTVLDGSDLADGTVVGAGAVIRAKTDANSIYVGIPARKLRERRLTPHEPMPEGPRPQD
ncbi:acyltransferase [Labrys monachus]|uniref:Acetyltransferase-like isoleucine patch superfamily enzyme n=1 Tax=Labrys monachus TaxID=217067 RepID=A0ABU0FDC2_9HYPH|nr:acyltransferase [Labrys monachus]MDQ0392593.1 acetyltransferase-like isoleucine patch superfamily enzyme [Labrys monachus]